MTEFVRASRDDIADKLEIRELIDRYADAASRGDPVAIADTFTADGEWTAAALGRFQGRDAMVSFFTAMLDGFNAFVQGVLSGRVFLDAADPDRARGRWFVLEIGQRTDGANLNVAGVYHDEYVREPGGWRIFRRRYDPLLSRADDVVTALPFPADVPTCE